jgi:hypothetical protein
MATGAPIVLVFDIFTLGNVKGRDTLGTECLAFVKNLIDREIHTIPCVVSSRADNSGDSQTITKFFSQIPTFASAEIPYAYDKDKEALYTGDTVLALYKHFMAYTTLPEAVYFFDRRQEHIDSMRRSNPNITSFLVTGEGFWDRVFEDVIRDRLNEEPNSPFTRLHKKTMALYAKRPRTSSRGGSKGSCRKGKSKRSKARKSRKTRKSRKGSTKK